MFYIVNIYSISNNVSFIFEEIDLNATLVNNEILIFIALVHFNFYVYNKKRKSQFFMSKINNFNDCCHFYVYYHNLYYFPNSFCNTVEIILYIIISPLFNKRYNKGMEFLLCLRNSFSFSIFIC